MTILLQNLVICQQKRVNMYYNEATGGKFVPTYRAYFGDFGEFEA